MSRIFEIILKKKFTRKLQQVTKQVLLLKHENLQMKHENLQLKHENLQLKQENLHLKKRMDELEKQVLLLKHENLQLKHENLQLKHENLQLKKKMDELENWKLQADERLLLIEIGQTANVLKEKIKTHIFQGKQVKMKKLGDIRKIEKTSEENHRFEVLLAQLKTAGLRWEDVDQSVRLLADKRNIVAHPEPIKLATIQNTIHHDILKTLPGSSKIAIFIIKLTDAILDSSSFKN